jgi:hypothetical protein
MFLSFGVPNKQFFAPAAPELFPKRQLEYFRSEYLWSQVTMGEYLVEIIQYCRICGKVLAVREKHCAYV